MRKGFQTQWQNISFSDFAPMSSKKLADPNFYNAFYKVFFHRYRNWDELPSDWRKTKRLWANFILGFCLNDKKVLSVGCGLGAIEHYLNEQNPELNLFIHEVAPNAWKWISEEFPEDRKIKGLIPSCLKDSQQFDLVYLATVDYALDDNSLIELLAGIRPFLSKTDGRCLLISASFEKDAVSYREKFDLVKSRLKALVAAGLDWCGLRGRGQFWGWVRTRSEYKSLMLRAGYRKIEDGFVDPKDRSYYWISGR